MKCLLLLTLLLSGCASARQVGSYHYLVEYSNGETRTYASARQGEIKDCALVVAFPDVRLILPFSWVTRIIEWADGQPTQGDRSQTKTLK